MPTLFRDRRDQDPAPLCPFCRSKISNPQELDGVWYEFEGGRCRCGAHFAVDPTARNGGAVLMQVLAQACDGDWDAALELRPEDYRVGYIHKYSSRDHEVNDSGFGTIYLVRRRDTLGRQED